MEMTFRTAFALSGILLVLGVGALWVYFPATNRSQSLPVTENAGSKEQSKHGDEPSGLSPTRDNGAAMTPPAKMSEADLEDLSGREPERAMALALAETQSEKRDQLRNTVLRGWAAKFPGAAADWAIKLPEGERHSAMEAVFSGAVKHPEQAVEVCRGLVTQDPMLAGDYGQMLISSLAVAGNYADAVRFASGGSQELGEGWLNFAFYRWASGEPLQALSALEGIQDPWQRKAALAGLVAGWSGDMDKLAGRILDLPNGKERAGAMAQALNQWVDRDPGNATTWLIDHFTPAPDLDEGTARAATLPTLIGRKPEIAVAWAESITEPTLRADTLKRVAGEWAQQNAAEVRQFLAANPNLPPEERQALAAGLAEQTPAGN